MARRKTLPKFFTEAEIHRLLSLSFPDTHLGRRDRAILELLVATGLRASELLDLRVMDIGEDYLFVRRGKGGRQRYVPLTRRAYAAVQAQIPFPCLPGDHVFLNAWGQKLSRRGLLKIVKGHLRSAGLKGCLHKVRHSTATMLLNRGLDLRSVQAILGHSHLSTTAIYLGIALDSLCARYQAALAA